MKKFDEAQLETAIIQLLEQQGYPYVSGVALSEQAKRAPEAVLIEADLRAFLAQQYKVDGITEAEIDSVVRQLEMLPASDLYDSNKIFCQWLSDGFLLKREDADQKDLYIQLLDYTSLAAGSEADANIYKLVNQLEIQGKEEKRIPDAILYINGLPLVVFEFKSAIREDAATIHHAYEQLTVRYRRDIPQLFVFNAFCVISDGVNNKMGSLFAPMSSFMPGAK